MSFIDDIEGLRYRLFRGEMAHSVRACLEYPIYTGKIRYSGEVYAGEHEAIISEGKFAAVQEIIAKNSETNGSIKQDKYNFLLESLVRCGECGSFMSPTHANGRNGRYFYYKCTSVMQRNRDACSVSHINARELETYVIDQLREISQNEVLVSKTIDEVNRLIREGVKPLLEDRDRIAARLKETQSKADRLVDALESGSVSIGRVEGRLGHWRMKRRNSNPSWRSLNLRYRTEKMIPSAPNLVRQTYGNFNLVFDNLTAGEKKRLIQLLIKQITYNKDIIEIDLYEFPHIGLDLGAHPDFLDERLRWLPGPTSQRIISVAKHKFPIYLVYDGRGISIVVGIAPIQPDERGIVSSDRLKTNERNHKWQNPLRLALRYKKLLDNGSTMANIARTIGASRARVTQVMNLLNLHPEIQDYLNNAEHTLDAKLLTERGLREFAMIQDSEMQLRAFRKLIL